MSEGNKEIAGNAGLGKIVKGTMISFLEKWDQLAIFSGNIHLSR